MNVFIHNFPVANNRPVADRRWGGEDGADRPTKPKEWILIGAIGIQ